MNQIDKIILIAIENMGGGGAERVALDLARHWPSGHSRPVLLLAHRAGELLEQVPPGIEILEVGVSSSPRSTLQFLLRLRKLLRGRKVVGVVSHMTGINRMMLRASRLSVVQAPVVVVEHNNFARNSTVALLSATKWALLQYEISWLYRGAHKVVGCSQGVADQIAHLFGLPSEKVCAIVNPLDQRFLLDPIPDPGMSSRLVALPRPLLVSSGRLVPQKGPADLLRAFACQPEGGLVILGEGPLRAELESLAEELGIATRVWMPGFVSAPELVLREADLYVSASHWEGYPLTLIEAYACGLPIVARACDFGPEEIVTPDRPGKLVRDNSIEALAEAIKDTLAHQPRFAPGTLVDLSVNDPINVARRYCDLFDK